jgi:hypothetical protein
MRTILGAASERVGILLRPALLTAASDATSPIFRGLRVRRRILCQNIPPPGDTIIAQRTQEIKELSRTEHSMRDIVANVTSPQTCMNCHASINPLGFALEGFDQIGTFRTTEDVYNSTNQLVASHPINSTVQNLDIGPNEPAEISSARELVGVIADSPRGQACFSQRVFEHSRKRAIDDQIDGCTMNAMEQSLSRGDTIQDVLMRNVVNADLFFKKVKQ